MVKIQTNRTPETLAKYEEVIRLRSVGLSFQAIAERVGYAGRQGAREAYTQAIKLWGGEAVNELRVLENERLDHLWRQTMGQLEQAQRKQADPETIMRIINTAGNISKRRSALNGLDAPRQVELTGRDGQPLETDVGQMLRDRLALLETKETPREIAPPNDSQGIPGIPGDTTESPRTPGESIDTR